MDLISYYNKFNEDKRLLSRHGQVEFNTTVNYILRYIKEPAGMRVADIGAGTGRYSIYLSSLGAEVTAIEYVKYNLGILKKNVESAKGIQLLDDIPNSARNFGDKGELCNNIKPYTVRAYQGDGRKLKRLADSMYDATLLFGPMYHLHSVEDKVKALSEAVRITKEGGYIFVAYVMADYAMIKHGFMEGNVLESLKKGSLTENYAIKSNPEELYDYVRISDIDLINSCVGQSDTECKNNMYAKAASDNLNHNIGSVKRVEIISPDGASDYIRPFLNDMDEETFRLFMDYQLKNASRPDLVGAGSHTVDILKVIK